MPHKLIYKVAQSTTMHIYGTNLRTTSPSDGHSLPRNNKISHFQTRCNYRYCTYGLLQHSYTLHFVHTVYLRVPRDPHNTYLHKINRLLLLKLTLCVFCDVRVNIKCNFYMPIFKVLIILLSCSIWHTHRQAAGSDDVGHSGENCFRRM